MPATCPGCRSPLLSVKDASGKSTFAIRHLPGCDQGTTRQMIDAAIATTKKPAGKSHYSAKATTCERGHNHPSKVEARVCAHVYAEWIKPDCIYRNVRLPLWSLPPTDAGIPHYCNVDFAVVAPSLIFVALVDAKSGRRSRDWERGRAAVEATYGVRVEERS